MRRFYFCNTGEAQLSSFAKPFHIITKKIKYRYGGICSNLNAHFMDYRGLSDFTSVQLLNPFTDEPK